jgi:hypothetical protein
LTRLLIQIERLVNRCVFLLPLVAISEHCTNG